MNHIKKLHNKENEAEEHCRVTERTDIQNKHTVILSF